MIEFHSRLLQFVNIQRNRFEIHRNNAFAAYFSKISFYCEYLEIIYDRSAEADNEFHRIRTAFQDSLKENKSGTLNPEQEKLLHKNSKVSTILNLEIESFYLFSKILLDHVARGIEFYFHQVRNASLDSHDKLCKNLEKYCENHILEIPCGFLETAQIIKQEIADFRDYEIAHEKGPTLHKGILYSSARRQSVIVKDSLPPSTKKSTESLPIPDLFDRIIEYLGYTMEFLELNQDKAYNQHLTKLAV